MDSKRIAKLKHELRLTKKSIQKFILDHRKNQKTHLYIILWQRFLFQFQHAVLIICLIKLFFFSKIVIKINIDFCSLI